MKKKTCLFAALLMCLFFASCRQPVSKEISPVKIILDTDIGPDFDDVGALTLLHAMADSGKAEILGVMASNKDSLVVPVIQVINTYFGRSNLPVGGPKNPGGVCLGSDKHWPDSLVRRFPYQRLSPDRLPDAVWQYRKLLASQPDHSVTIVTIGFLTNLAHLIDSKGDTLSPLDGRLLVEKKVQKLVSMAGWFPSGKEYNLYMDSLASAHVYREWPSPVIFTGFEVGEKIHTGLELVRQGDRSSPVAEAFRIAMAGVQADINGHMSWDQTAVLIAIFGTDRFFQSVPGRIMVRPDGSNGWENLQEGKQRYVTIRGQVQDLEHFIDARMLHKPLTHPTR
ncbi:MAG: nucleoside hydrolase [Marinilabiliales bacterium]|nr:nucleoside hydrolase [Marinilabiliales bacterium]